MKFNLLLTEEGDKRLPFIHWNLGVFSFHPHRLKGAVHGFI